MTSVFGRFARPASVHLGPLALSCVALACASHAHAQATPKQAPNGLPTVMVTATRTPLNLNQVLADVTVLTRADIERQSFGALADLLRSQSCFEFVRNGGPGTSTSVFLRGANTQHTVVLIDGVRMDTQSGSGGASWQNIPLAQIERVEIVRGAASAVYGSDAIAGVVQVFTRKAGGAPYLEIGAGLGSLGTAKSDLNVSGSVGALDYALTLAGESSDGFNVRPSSDPLYTPDTDNWRNHSVSARLGWNIHPGHRIEVLSLQSHSNAGYDASAKPKAGVDDRSINDNLSARAQWTAKWSDQWQSELSVGHATDRYETTPSTYLTETQARSYTLHNSLKLGPGQLNVQLERREDRLISAGLTLGNNGQAKRSQNAVGAAYLLSQNTWDAQAHFRHDDDSEFGGINTGTVAAGLRFSPQWRAWASAGTSFRAPTLYQSFSQYGPKPGAPKLKAERGRNQELGISYQAERDQLSLTVFSNQVRDLISWDSQFVANCPPSKNPQPWDGCYGNLAKVNLKGVSLKGGTEVLGLRVSGSLDWLSPKDARTGLQLGRRASKHASLRVDKTVGPWALGAQVLASGRRFDFNDNKTRLGGYALLNLDLQYEVNAQLRVLANLDNAFNRAYQTAGGYAQAPRTVFVGLRYSPSL